MPRRCSHIVIGAKLWKGVPERHLLIGLVGPPVAFRVLFQKPVPTFVVGIGEGKLHGPVQAGLVQDWVIIRKGLKLDHALP